MVAISPPFWPLDFIFIPDNNKWFNLFVEWNIASRLPKFMSLAKELNRLRGLFGIYVDKAHVLANA